MRTIVRYVRACLDVFTVELARDGNPLRGDPPKRLPDRPPSGVAAARRRVDGLVARKDRHRRRMTVLERFLRYVTYDTRSDDASQHVSEHAGAARPAAAARGRAARARRGRRRRRRQRLPDGDDSRRPPSATCRTIGFIAHVDTSPEMAGSRRQADRAPRPGTARDIVLPDDPVGGAARRRRSGAGRADGATTSSRRPARRCSAPTTRRAWPRSWRRRSTCWRIRRSRTAPIRIAFTPDEEIGRGADHFDVARFGAVCAYTLDGGSRGELEYESFSADAMRVTFQGFNTHPGYAKGRMVNAIKVAARLHRPGCPPIRCRRRRPTATKASCTRTCWTRRSTGPASAC